jgi:DNA repair photolyase
MDVIEIEVKTALVRSRIAGVNYVINPYLGCSHGCRYCYAAFMRKYSRCHQQARWGTFVEWKANIVELLRKELSRKRSRGTVLLSSVCDPYQPVERQRLLTRGCLEALGEFGWEVEVLTRSPLVTRDLDILATMPQVSVGFSIGTDSEQVRSILEPGAPPIQSRVEALKELHKAGITTWVFIAPMLPMDPRGLYEMVSPYVDYVLVDALNYPQQVREVFLRNRWNHALTPEYAIQTGAILRELFGDCARQI